MYSTVPSTPYVTQKTRSLFLKHVHPFVHIPLPHILNVMSTCYFSLNATNCSHPVITICSSLAQTVNALKKNKKLKVLLIEDIPLCFNSHNKTKILYNYWYFVTAGYGRHTLIRITSHLLLWPEDGLQKSRKRVTIAKYQ